MLIVSFYSPFLDVSFDVPVHTHSSASFIVHKTRQSHSWTKEIPSRLHILVICFNMGNPIDDLCGNRCGTAPN